MGATSVTGRGKGESFGEHKPQNGGGCCQWQTPIDNTPKIRNNYCTTRYSTGSVIRHKVGGTNSIKICR